MKQRVAVRDGAVLRRTPPPMCGGLIEATPSTAMPFRRRRKATMPRDANPRERKIDSFLFRLANRANTRFKVHLVYAVSFLIGVAVGAGGVLIWQAF